jgi:transposase-like protein
VIHLLRNTFRYASRRYWDQIAKDIRPVYTAPTEAAAKERFVEFTAKWGAQYPAIIRLWERLERVRAVLGLPQRPRHGYAAVLHRGLPERGFHRPGKFANPTLTSG